MQKFIFAYTEFSRRSKPVEMRGLRRDKRAGNDTHSPWGGQSYFLGREKGDSRKP